MTRLVSYTMSGEGPGGVPLKRDVFLSYDQVRHHYPYNVVLELCREAKLIRGTIMVRDRDIESRWDMRDTGLIMVWQVDHSSTARMS